MAEHNFTAPFALWGRLFRKWWRGIGRPYVIDRLAVRLPGGFLGQLDMPRPKRDQSLAESLYMRDLHTRPAYAFRWPNPGFHPHPSDRQGMNFAMPFLMEPGQAAQRCSS